MRALLSGWARSLVPAMLLLLTGCGGSGGPTHCQEQQACTVHGFSGVAQKGPLIFGSEINVYELGADLKQTGRSFEAQTSDDLGNFRIEADIETGFVSIVGVGYYMDENTGRLSSAPITLAAIVDLSIDSSPTINVLTTLATPRIRQLMRLGRPYSDAMAQAQVEVLSAFGIDAARIEGLGALYSMRINGTTDQDAALLTSWRSGAFQPVSAVVCPPD